MFSDVVHEKNDTAYDLLFNCFWKSSKQEGAKEAGELEKYFSTEKDFMVKDSEEKKIYTMSQMAGKQIKSIGYDIDCDTDNEENINNTLYNDEEDFPEFYFGFKLPKQLVNCGLISS